MTLPVVGEHAARRALAPVRTPHWWPSPANRRFVKHRQALVDVADELVAKRAAGDGGGSDLLSLLLAERDPETGEGLSRQEVRDEALLFLIGGHETTGSALAFTFQLLGRHPDVQEAVRAEADGAGITAGAVVDAESLLFTTQVVQESLRLFPPAHTVVRSAVDDTEVLGRPVGRDDIIAVSIWGIHHRPALWPRPDAFCPERFRTDDGEASPGATTRYAHLPFGGGPRACVGEHLAMTELVVGVASVMTRLRVEALLATPPTEVDLTLRPHGTLPARFERLTR